jgi:hypothetical protein
MQMRKGLDREEGGVYVTRVRVCVYAHIYVYKKICAQYPKCYGLLTGIDQSGRVAYVVFIGQRSRREVRPTQPDRISSHHVL